MADITMKTVQLFKSIKLNEWIKFYYEDEDESYFGYPTDIGNEFAMFILWPTTGLCKWRYFQDDDKIIIEHLTVKEKNMLPDPNTYEWYRSSKENSILFDTNQF